MVDIENNLRATNCDDGLVELLIPGIKFNDETINQINTILKKEGIKSSSVSKNYSHQGAVVMAEYDPDHDFFNEREKHIIESFQGWYFEYLAINSSDSKK